MEKVFVYNISIDFRRFVVYMHTCFLGLGVNLQGKHQCWSIRRKDDALRTAYRG